MPTLTFNHPELIEAEEKEVFFDEYEAQEQMFQGLFKIETSSKAYEDRAKVAALGRFALKPEGTPVGFDDPVSVAKVRSVHSTYALGFRITMEMQDDDQFGIMRQMPSDLGASAADHRERLAWGVLNDGFTGSTYTGLTEGDGTARALFSTGHVNIKTATTQSNMLSPAVALSVTGLESALTRFSLLQSDEDRYINVTPSTLVYHPNLQHQAHVLLNTEYRPGGSDNDRSTVVSSRSGIAPLRKEGIPYLSSQTAWYLFAAKGKHGLCWYDRKAVSFRRANDSDTFDMKFYGFYRATPAVNDWRGSLGSNA